LNETRLFIRKNRYAHGVILIVRLPPPHGAVIVVVVLDQDGDEVPVRIRPAQLNDGSLLVKFSDCLRQ